MIEDEGDGRALEFAERIRRHQVQVFGYIYSLVRNLDDADDLFQQASLAMWHKYDTFDPSRSFVAWACGVARFEVANFLRARSRRRLYLSDDLGLLLAEAQEREEAGRDAEAERLEALAGCLDRLGATDRALVEACYGEHPGRVSEVARARGRSPQSLHNSLKRIRRALFDCVRRKVEPGGVA